MYTGELPLPIGLCMCGALAGLVGGGCTEYFPVWVGATTGASVGCIICIIMAAMPEPFRAPIVPRIQGSTEPVVIQNLYITYVSGQAKDIPVAKVIG